MSKAEKLPKWAIKEQKCCDALRASVGAKFGDGLALLKKMESGNEAQRMLAKTYRSIFMSVNRADALVSLYASNPLIRALMEGSLAPTGEPDAGDHDRDPVDPERA